MGPEILAKGRSDTHCKIKETLLIPELEPTLNDNVSISLHLLYANFSQLLSLFLSISYLSLKFSYYSYYKRSLLKIKSEHTKRQVKVK